MSLKRGSDDDNLMPNKRRRAKLPKTTQDHGTDDQSGSSTFAKCEPDSEYCEPPAAEEPEVQGQKPKNQPKNKRKSAREEAKELKNEVASLKIENRKLLAQNYALREDCMELTNQMECKYPKMDDQRIRDQLFDMQRECQDWVKEFSIPGPLAILSEKRAKKLLIYPIPGKLCATKTRTLSSLIDFKCEIHLILERALSWFIYTKVLEQPFNCFQKSFEGWRFLNRMFQHAQGTENDRFGEWVGDTIEAAEHNLSKNQPTCPRIPLETRDCKLCSFANKFLINTPRFALRYLDNIEKERCAKELSSLVHKAGKLARLLWRQRTGLECLYDAENLKSDGLKIDTVLVEHHGTSFMHIDRSFDGHGIALVIQPAIVSHIPGGKRKVWAKATALSEDWMKATLEAQTLQGEGQDTLGNCDEQEDVSLGPKSDNCKSKEKLPESDRPNIPTSIGENGNDKRAKPPTDTSATTKNHSFKFNDKRYPKDGPRNAHQSTFLSSQNRKQPDHPSCLDSQEMRPLPSTARDEKHDKRELHRGTRPQSDMHPQCTEVEGISPTSSSETLVQKSPTWPSPIQGSRYEQMAPDVYVKPPKCNPATRQKNRKGCPESKDRSYQSEGVRKDSDDSAMDVDSVHIKQEEDYDEMVMSDETAEQTDDPLVLC